jgi:dTDP-4-amino-4,6-dideoxygalactose transaminase
VNVPPLELRSSYLALKPKIDAAVLKALDSGTYIGGTAVTEFERAFAEFCGAQHCVGLANGLDALHLALRALGVGPGDRVILASNSYIATVLAVSMAGAEPVFVEPDAATFTLDPSLLETAIDSRTRAVIPTHLFGHPADLDPILSICRKHALYLVEDAAQAHGASYKGQPIGSHGDIVCWSFYPTKNLGAAGDAGAITTNNKDLADLIRSLGNYGSRERYISDLKGVNSRLDPLQAAILNVKLTRLKAWNDRRAQIADRYRSALAECDTTLPISRPWAEHVWHQFVIRTDRRNDLQAGLAARGVGTLIHYPVPPHLQHAYADLGLPAGTFPIAERIARESLSLPIWPELDDERVDFVIDAVRAELRKLSA